MSELRSRRAIFLDRDGVINRAIIRDQMPHPPTRVSEFEILPGVLEACERLRRAGFLLVVATNQPDVGRGLVPREAIEDMHQQMRALLPLDGIETCYHPGRGQSNCDCRKPKPGMLLSAAGTLGIDLARSWMVGDRWRDVNCGHAAGCRTIFIESHYAEPLRQPPDFIAQDLPSAVEIIVAQ